MKNAFLEISPVQYCASATKTLHFSFLPHNRCFRPHWHDRMELIRIRSGGINVSCGTYDLSLSVGELLIIPPKMLHTAYADLRGAEYDVLMFDVRSFYNETDICKSLLPAIFDGTATFNATTSNPEIIRCVDSVSESNGNTALENISKIYRLLSLLYENELAQLQPQRKDTVVKRIVDYLEKNFSVGITVDLLCKEFGYTPAHLCRKFKQAIGLSPMSYLKIYRLESAYQKIKNSDTSIGDIAAQCGFWDPNYFTRCFKSHFGIPPTGCRKNSLYGSE